MVKWTPERKAERIEATKLAAASLLEDIPHIRSIVANDNPSNAEIRRLSAVLRRIVVESDLSAVGTPRIGPVVLKGPDLKGAYHAERHRPFLFFMSGRATILGGWSGTIWAYDVVTPNFVSRVALPSFGLHQTMDQPLETFRKQNVLCYRGKWATRKGVIKYIANIGGGVHAGKEADPEDELLSLIRNSARLKKDAAKDGIHLDLMPHGIDVDISTFKHQPDAIDPVMIELLAAATFLVQSPYIDELEKCLQAEFSK